MPSIFSKIIAGNIPSYKVAESEKCFAFLDVNPLAKGHVLVVPKKEVDYIFDVEDELYLELMAFAKKVGKAVKTVVPCKRIGVTVIGLEVPHAHVHLIPMNSIDDMNFEKPKLSLSKDEFVELAEKISAAMES
jgi:histidine triad (HIT) family protein